LAAVELFGAGPMRNFLTKEVVMQNRKDIEDAHQAWKDRQGTPRGTPEQGERSADRVGGDGPPRPEPEIEDADVEPATRRAPKGDEPEDD
jgi:hypothetical protein